MKLRFVGGPNHGIKCNYRFPVKDKFVTGISDKTWGGHRYKRVGLDKEQYVVFQWIQQLPNA